MAGKKVSLQTFKREWFYYIDHKVTSPSPFQGLLFLEETEPKNFTSCLKETKFLVIQQ